LSKRKKREKCVKRKKREKRVKRKKMGKSAGEAHGQASV